MAEDHTDSKSLTVGIVSDLHAFDPDSGSPGDPPSHLSTASPEDQPNLHPISGLLKLIRDEVLSADILICCGDIGDKANPSAIKFGWERIQRIKSALNAKALIATPGNHDLDSRYKYNDFDAKGFLQSLTPPFPFDDSPTNDKFWSRNFVVTEESGCRFLVINTSAYHGGKQEEILHGRVATRTIEAIRLALDGTPSNRLNIAVCHHHPFRYGDIAVQEYSEMQGGENLLELLGSGQFGRWLIIHGHKHHPRICYGPGSTAAPVIFSAGSLCAHLYAQIQNRARNQFYLIEFPWGRLDELRLELAGRFFTWDWITAKGWQRAAPQSDHSELPPIRLHDTSGPFSLRGRTERSRISFAAQFRWGNKSDREILKWQPSNKIYLNLSTPVGLIRNRLRGLLYLLTITAI
jgi:Calcineurin-like phosphoesterase